MKVAVRRGRLREYFTAAHGGQAGKAPGRGVVAGRARRADSRRGDVKTTGRKRDLQAEVERLRAIVAAISLRERDELRAEAYVPLARVMVLAFMVGDSRTT